MIKVIKRDGREVEFDRSKIEKAIEKAVFATHNDKKFKDIASKVADGVCNEVTNKILTVEDIQDAVELKLMDLDKLTAQSYIRFRHDKSEKRHQEQSIDKKVQGLIDMSGEVTKENANKDATVFNTKRDLLAGIVSKDFALRKMMPKFLVEGHEKGYWHKHDLDYAPFMPMYNCMLIDFEEMFKGFQMGNANIETPKSIKTATALIAQIVANVSSNIYGGTTVNGIDTLLSPYAKLSHEKHYKKHLDRFAELKMSQSDMIKLAEKYSWEDTRKEIYDSMQSLEYEINTIYNSNGGL